MERDGDSVGMEDLDSLQLELESLLSSVVVSLYCYDVDSVGTKDLNSI